MKNLYLLITVSIVIFYSSVNAQWVQTNVPSGGSAGIVTISGTKLFTVSYVSGISFYFYASTDNGATWTIAGESGKRGPMALAGNGSNIFAGYFFSHGLYLSTNNGTEWTPVNSFPSPNWITALAINGEKVLVGTMSGGVHLSTNNGSNWTTSILDESVSISSFIISEANIFTGTSGAGVFLSTDNGGSWIPINNGLTDTIVSSLVASGTNIFSGTGSGVYLSTNNGTNWTQVNNGLNNSSINDFAVSGNNIFAGTDSIGVYLSTDNGTSWAQVNDGLTSRDVFSLAVNGDNIFAGTGDGVWRRPLSEMITTGVEDQSNEIPFQYLLEQNYPNPFNPTTTIGYVLQEKSSTKLTLMNAIGEEIAVLVNEEQDKGYHRAELDGKNLSSGVYFYKLSAGSFFETRKMILMK